MNIDDPMRHWIAYLTAVYEDCGTFNYRRMYARYMELMG